MTALSPPSVLPPEHIAWRLLMHSLCEASDVKHNDPYPSENPLQPCEVDPEIQSYTEDIALLQTLIQHKRNLNAPLRRRPLPNETLLRIFLDCRGMDSWAPAAVSHVCRRWRQVALGHPALWSCIELGRGETALHRVSEWAERARKMPMDLVVRCSEHADRVDMIPWLREKADGIKSLAMFHMDLRADNRLLPSLPPFARLEALRILGLEEFDLDLRWVARLLEGSPRLTSLSLAGVSSLRCPESLIGVAAQLTHLSIGALSHTDYQFPIRVDAVLQVISACGGLQSLECHTLALPDEGDLPSPTVSLPHLSTLSIGDGPETCIILKYLYAPQLHTFRLVRGSILDEHEEEVERPVIDDSWNGYIEFFVDCLRSLHETCSPPITTVIWDCTVVDVCVLDHCTLYLRAMEELECHGLMKTGEVSPCGFLYIGAEGSACPYPQLRSMTFTKCTLGGLRSESIEAAINVRGPPFSLPITRVVVEDCQGARNRYLSRLSTGEGGWTPIMTAGGRWCVPGIHSLSTADLFL
jgi:hypothetical protein